MHIGSGLSVVSLEGLNPMTEIAGVIAYSLRSSVNLMVSPLLRKYPDAKVVWSEGGIGWIPAAIERADQRWERHQYWSLIENAHIKSSDVALRSMYFCMIEEPLGIKYHHDFTVDNMYCPGPRSVRAPWPQARRPMSAGCASGRKRRARHHTTLRACSRSKRRRRPMPVPCR